VLPQHVRPGRHRDPTTGEARYHRRRRHDDDPFFVFVFVFFELLLLEGAQEEEEVNEYYCSIINARDVLWSVFFSNSILLDSKMPSKKEVCGG